MAMARNINELQAVMRPEGQARIDETVHNMALVELREEQQLTQAELARRMGKNQGTISKLERRTGMHLSTLRSYIEGMGGRLDLVAAFPDGKIHIIEFKREGRS